MQDSPTIPVLPIENMLFEDAIGDKKLSKEISVEKKDTVASTSEAVLDGMKLSQMLTEQSYIRESKEDLLKILSQRIAVNEGIAKDYVRDEDKLEQEAEKRMNELRKKKVA